MSAELAKEVQRAQASPAPAIRRPSWLLTSAVFCAGLAWSGVAVGIALQSDISRPVRLSIAGTLVGLQLITFIAVLGMRGRRPWARPVIRVCFISLTCAALLAAVIDGAAAGIAQLGASGRLTEALAGLLSALLTIQLFALVRVRRGRGRSLWTALAAPWLVGPFFSLAALFIWASWSDAAALMAGDRAMPATAAPPRARLLGDGPVEALPVWTAVLMPPAAALLLIAAAGTALFAPSQLALAGPSLVAFLVLPAVASLGISRGRRWGQELAAWGLLAAGFSVVLAACCVLGLTTWSGYRPAGGAAVAVWSGLATLVLLHLLAIRGLAARRAYGRFLLSAVAAFWTVLGAGAGLALLVLWLLWRRPAEISAPAPPSRRGLVARMSSSLAPLSLLVILPAGLIAMTNVPLWELAPRHVTAAEQAGRWQRANVTLTQMIGEEVRHSSEGGFPRFRRLDDLAHARLLQFQLYLDLSSLDAGSPPDEHIALHRINLRLYHAMSATLGELFDAQFSGRSERAVLEEERLILLLTEAEDVQKLLAPQS